ncbi:MAG TPA: GGDEF domain-containing protein [bacterium]|nr:GGDEF domain-containing protein [bacterium]
MDGRLDRVADVMTPAPVFVSVRDTAGKASAAFRQHRLPVMPVLDGGALAGVLGPLDLMEERPFRPVSDLMTRGVVAATPDLPLLQAHALLVSQGRDALPVLDGDRAVGHLTLSAVLRAVNQQTDPLTGLPWATGLRMWAADALARGREVAVLFIDLDNFREVNKTLGHVAGDGVLRSVAGLLQQCTDPMTDLLCRYGGDEFAIATTRPDGDAEALADRVQEIVTVPVAETDRRVTVTVGFAGGRRHEERGPGHVASTVDDLLALASRASTLAKSSPEGAARRATWHSEAAPPSEARVQLVDVHLEWRDGRSSAEVRLRLGPREVVGVSSDLILTPNAAPRFMVAEATLRALHGILGDRPVYTVEDVLDSLSASHPLVVAVVSARRKGSRNPERYIGGATARDLPRAVCKAVLDAVNRPIARALGVLLETAAAPTTR